MATVMRYTLNEFNEITFNGFNYKLPEETVRIISELALEVGSPTYVKTPVFQKRENFTKVESNFGQKDSGNFKNKHKNKNSELNDEDWNAVRTFQTTVLEEKVGLDVELDMIRSYLNKLTDKNYIDMRNKIVDVIELLLSKNISSEDLNRVGTTIFDIASNNRFFSKTYAELYSDLISKYEIMRSVFEDSFTKFMGLFNVIEYVDPAVDYDQFCKITKDNEKRRALSSFFVNLMNNNIISKEQIILITRNLMSQIYTFISQENKKNEVDEITENISLLYKKELYDKSSCSYEKIDNMTIIEIIEKLARSKVKDYKSLTNKTIFKFMDMIDM